MELPFAAALMNIFYQLVVSVKPDFSAPTFTVAIGELSSEVGTGFWTKPKAEIVPMTTMVIIISFFIN